VPELRSESSSSADEAAAAAAAAVVVVWLLLSLRSDLFLLTLNLSIVGLYTAMSIQVMFVDGYDSCSAVAYKNCFDEVGKRTQYTV
jgi:hypothetical protein